MMSRVLFVEHRGDVMYRVRRDPPAAVEIGDESDPQAVQRGRQTANGQIAVCDDELMALVEIAVSTGCRDCAGGGCDRAFQHRAPCDCHRLI
jgi:hypothetical protein